MRNPDAAAVVIASIAIGLAPEGSLVEVRVRVPAGMARRFMPASMERDVVDAVLSLASRRGQSFSELRREL